MLPQDESCIAAHLGERTPKGAEDESATLEQQDDTEQGDDHNASVDGTGDSTLPLPAKSACVTELTKLEVHKEEGGLSALYSNICMVL